MGSADPGPAGPPLAVLGIDHHRAPVAVRERLAIAADQVPSLLAGLRALPGVDEAVALSTCNRLELYLAGAAAPEAIAAALAAFRGIDAAELAGVRTWRSGGEAAHHCFRVAAGLDSLVLGEDQILHQVKEAYELARACAATGSHLNLLFQRSLAVAKEVRTDTGIGRHKLSVASIAVDLARHVVGDIAGCRLLVVGAGEMGELVLTHLRAAGVAAITVINRSRDRAEALAAAHPGARAADWSELGACLAEHDLVACSTAAPHAVISAEAVRQAARRRRRPLVLIDLAVPRDVEPAAADLEDVYLFNIDHLEQVVAGHREKRSGELAAAEALVAARLRAFLAERRPGRDGLLAQVAAWFDDVVAAEAARLEPRLADPAQREAVRYGLARVAGKLQHRLLARLKRDADPDAERFVRELLDLDPPPGPD